MFFYIQFWFYNKKLTDLLELKKLEHNHFYFILFFKSILNQ